MFMAGEYEKYFASHLKMEETVVKELDSELLSLLRTCFSPA